MTETANGKTRFIATVPAMGYCLFAIGGDEVSEAAEPMTAAGDRLENEFYAIRFDPATGVVLSIVDKQLKRELLDTAAPKKFNQLIWGRSPDRLSPQLRLTSPPAGQSLTGHVGPVSAEMIARINDPNTGAAVTQTLRLYRGLKRIDVVNDLRHAVVMHSARHQDRYRDNLLYAFPFKVDNFQARAEYAAGVVRPYADQLRWGSHDYLTANRWVDVSNTDFGITMAPWNAPTVMFGGIRYNQFANDYKPTNSKLFSYAWSNRMAGLLTLGPDDCNATFGYSFTSHDGDWDSGETTRFGWSIASPLQATAIAANANGRLPANSASLASIDASNVQLSTLKLSAQPGRGWVLRLIETEGKSADVSIALPYLPVSRAVESDLVENDGKALAFADKSVRLKIGPYECKTIRVFADEQPAAAVTAKAEAIADNAIRLSWTAAENATAFNIYRSTDPDAPPTQHSLIGRYSGTEFVDTGLTLDTNYTYFVAPASAKTNPVGKN